MDIWHSIVLGVIQGLTEFLPVSSSGHLVLAQKIFGMTSGALTMDILLHVGTLAALLFVYWQQLLTIIRHPFSKLAKLVWLAVIPTAIIGIIFKDVFDQLFENGKTLGIEFLLTGVIIWFADRKNAGVKTVKNATYVDAGIVGILQGAAILPAISRSGLTITGALLRGFDREFAANFSFLVSVPVIFGATLLELKDLPVHADPSTTSTTSAIAFVPALAGMIAAAIAGYGSIRYMIRIISQARLRVFSYYVWVLGILILFDQFVTHIWF